MNIVSEKYVRKVLFTVILTIFICYTTVHLSENVESASNDIYGDTPENLIRINNPDFRIFCENIEAIDALSSRGFFFNN